MVGNDQVVLIALPAWCAHSAICMVCSLRYPHGVLTPLPSMDIYRYHRRMYLEPLALHMQLFAGTFATVTVDLVANKITVAFVPTKMDNYTYTSRMLRVTKMSDARPGKGFTLSYPMVGGMYQVPASVASMDITYTL